MNNKLHAKAAAQGGAFTRSQALTAGYTTRQIRALVRREWAEPYRGVYVERTLLEGPAERRHVVLTAARLLTSSLEPVASHRTGALVHELPLLGRPPKVPQLTRAPRRARDRSETSTLRVAPLPAGDVVDVAGIRVTSLLRTACDVARTTPLRDGVVVSDAVLRRGIPPADLVATAQRFSRWPGGPRGVQVARLADGRADGPLESLTRLAYASEGLPAPEPQIEVWSPSGEFLGLVDFLWRDQRVVGEADGLGKYDTPLALKKEKLREEGLRACGLDVVRNTWDDVWTAAARACLALRVRQCFGYAARHAPVPGVVFRTPSLTELLLPPWDRPY